MIRKNGLMKNIASLVLAAVCAAGICGMQVWGETAPASSEAKTETAAAPAEDFWRPSHTLQDRTE